MIRSSLSGSQVMQNIIMQSNLSILQSLTPSFCEYYWGIIIISHYQSGLKQLVSLPKRFFFILLFCQLRVKYHDKWTRRVWHCSLCYSSSLRPRVEPSTKFVTCMARSTLLWYTDDPIRTAKLYCGLGESTRGTALCMRRPTKWLYKVLSVRTISHVQWGCFTVSSLSWFACIFTPSGRFR